MNTTQKIFWLLKMAWRDSRRNRSRLLLFMSSVTLGIAALVAIYSLGFNLSRQIDRQAAALLGTDLEWISNKPFSDEAIRLADSLASEKSEELSFASMVFFPQTGESRLMQVRALEGDYPYYGALETLPASAAASFRRRQAALVDQNVLLQYHVAVGDSVKIGELTFLIDGALENTPGQTGITASVAPVVYIPLRFLEKTGLLEKGSRINYRQYLKLAEGASAQALADSLRNRLEEDDIDIRTIEDQKASTGRMFRNLTGFLGLAGFVALLLGCVGVASAVHIYVKGKIAGIAILRCLGAKASHATFIFLIQIVCIGFAGSVAGAIAGSLLQYFLPGILREFLPFPFEAVVSYQAVLQGILLGVIISVLFSLAPLLGIRKVAPLHVFRVSSEEKLWDRDPLRWISYMLIPCFVLLFGYFQLKEWRAAIAFTLGVTGAFLLLTGTAYALIRLVRQFFPSGWNYLVRQGLSNLFRPNNQTVVMVVSVGLGAMLISTLLLTRSMLLRQINLSASGDRPNMVLFDIQDHQLDEVKDLTVSSRLPVLQSVPIVNMRLESVNGRNATASKKDSSNRRIPGMFSREYRVTYRDSLTASEKVTAGKWIGHYHENDPLVPVSVEAGFAERNGLKTGDTLRFNVQGTPVSTVIASLREVDWQSMQTNFIVVFPQGILEAAPKFHVLLTRMENLEQSAGFQRLVVTRFPNISMVDLALVIKVVDNVSRKVGFVIRLMAGFSVLTGLLVLVASVMISRYQRIRESILLRTLGAKKMQVFVITGMEYLFLGVLASLTGVILSLGAGWALARFSFETEFQPDWAPLAVVFVIIPVVTLLIGLLNSSGLMSRSPLEILREETE